MDATEPHRTLGQAPVSAKRAAKRAAKRVLGPPLPALEEGWMAYSLLRGTAGGVLLEVGAHQGDTPFLHFARDGWDVHAFEPDPENRAWLERRTAGMPNVTVVPKAVAGETGTLTLYRSPESTGISSLAAFTEGHRAAGEVKVTTLRDYVSEAGLASVTLLKLDVEGYEKFVLDGYPWETHRPKMILLEFEDRKTRPLGYSWRDLAETLRGHGYQVLVSEWYPIERYGVEHRWRRFATYPAELHDPMAWGNLLATTGGIAELERAARIARARLWVWQTAFGLKVRLTRT